MRTSRHTIKCTKCPARITLELEDGPVLRRRLLSRFSSLRGVRGASEAELGGAIGAAAARPLRQHFDG